MLNAITFRGLGIVIIMYAIVHYAIVIKIENA